MAPYSQFLRHWEHASRSYFDVETYSFKGPAVYDGTKSKDLNVESDTDAKYAASITNGWLASLQHQFVSAIVPPAGQPYQYQLQVRDNEYLLSAAGPPAMYPRADRFSSMKNSSSAPNCNRSWEPRIGASSAPLTSAF